MTTKTLCDVENAAYSHRRKLERDPNSTDLSLALAMADYWIACARGRMIRLYVLRSDTRQAKLRPLDVYGIATRDAEQARDWCTKALLAGYSVFQKQSHTGSSLASARGR
jgi:hypothetical protein